MFRSKLCPRCRPRWVYPFLEPLVPSMMCVLPKIAFLVATSTAALCLPDYSLAQHIVLNTQAPNSDEKALLADAVEQGNLERANSLLDAGETVRATQADGMTALHWAVYHENIELVGRILARGADANAKNAYAITPLSLACTNGNEGVVRELLHHGADANLAIAGGETPLMTAARTGRVRIVDELIGRGAKVNDRERIGDQSAIHWAANDGHAEVVASLIAAGADPMDTLPSGFTPLLLAARQGHRETVRTLLDAGVPLNSSFKKKSNSRSPRPGTNALMLAVENGHFELAIDLIHAGADPNDDSSGFAPLHAMSWVRKPNRGEDPDGDPPPHGSGSLTSEAFIRELVALGADVNQQVKKYTAAQGRTNKSDATPFFLAADTADTPFMRLLVELGADPNLANADDTTPLLIAAGVGTFAPGEEAGTEEEVIECLRYLLELGADIHHVDKHGETVMHGAAYKGTPKVVEFLAEQGARIDLWNRENRFGWTPLEIAQGHRHGNFRPLADVVAAIEKVMK